MNGHRHDRHDHKVISHHSARKNFPLVSADLALGDVDLVLKHGPRDALVAGRRRQAALVTVVVVEVARQQRHERDGAHVDLLLWKRDVLEVFEEVVVGRVVQVPRLQVQVQY